MADYRAHAMVISRVTNALRSLVMENSYDVVLAESLAYEIEETADGLVVRLPNLVVEKPGKRVASRVEAVEVAEELPTEPEIVIDLAEDGEGSGAE